MKRMHMKSILVICFIVIAVLASCSSSTTLSDEEKNRMEELGNAFMEEIKLDILPNRESPETLIDKDIVLVIGDKTYNSDRLYAFYEDYKVGQNTQLTSVISNKGFVVIRVVFDENSGYYFRYEYDSFKENNITITSQPLDQIKLVEDTGLKKVELQLFRVKKDPIVFSFRNLMEETQGETI